MARDARKYHGLTLMGTFVAGAFFDAFVMRLGCTRTEASPVSISGKTIVLEERGPPTKQELGQAGWTLLHTMAANYPDQPTAAQRARIEAFLHALGHLYPCPDCAAHFRLHMKGGQRHTRRAITLDVRCAQRGEFSEWQGHLLLRCRSARREMEGLRL